jgi:hypothetical protein
VVIGRNVADGTTITLSLPFAQDFAQDKEQHHAA